MRADRPVDALLAVDYPGHGIEYAVELLLSFALHPSHGGKLGEIGA